MKIFLNDSLYFKRNSTNIENAFKNPKKSRLLSIMFE